MAARNTLVAQGDELTGLAELYAIYTLPDHWRQGVGRKLLEAARKELQTQGWPGMVLWVLRDNARARRFYESMGLTPTGQQREPSPPRCSTSIDGAE